MYNAFVAGIQPGGLTNDFEVKILICFLMDQVGKALPFEQIGEILREPELVNYFEFAESMSELTRSGHLLLRKDEDGVERLEITEIGRATAKAFGKTLPLTVREKTMDYARKAICMEKRLSEVDVKYHRSTDGFILSLTIKDTGSDLLSLNLFLPDEEECLTVQEKLYSDPSGFYQGLLDLVLNSDQHQS